jgi:hypothetical protein
MRFNACEAVERAAFFEPDGSAGRARQIDDLLKALTSGATSDEDAIQRALGAQRFHNGMNSNQNGQLPIIPRS